MSESSTSDVRAQLDLEPPYLASGVTFLFAARIPAWLIAFFVVLVDVKRPENLAHEPLLLIYALVQVLLLIAYVPWVRPWLRGWIGAPLRGRRDLLVLSALDMASCFAILFWSGGLGTPYYHYAVVALLIPTFLLGWRGSLAVLAAFLVGIVASWEYSGLGRAAWTSREALGGSSPGLLLTPVLVVLVAQYLGWLARRIDAARHETVVALDRTAALYRVSQGMAQDGEATHLAEIVVEALRATGRFDRLTVVSLEETEVLPPADFEAVDGDLLHVRVRRAGAHSGVGSAGAASGDEPMLAIPFGDQRSGQSAIAFDGPDTGPGSTDVRLVRAAARQLTVALSRLALEEEREVLIAAEERARIAREIHDGIAQSIYMLSLQLDRLADQAPADSELAERLQRLTTLSKETLVDVRQYIFDVKPLLTGEITLAQTLERQATEFSAVADVPVSVSVHGDEPFLAVPLRSALYRVSQEGLANAVRHANASRIDLRLEFRVGHVDLEIADDGVGFDPTAAGSGHGLGNIRERVAELGGTCQVRSSPTAGTTIRVEVPLSTAVEVTPR